MEFGDKTLSGYGAYQMKTGATSLTNVSRTGGTASTGNFNLTSGGEVTPSSNGSLSGEDGNTIEVSSDQGNFTFTFDIITDCYSIGSNNIDELTDVMKLAALNYGEQIRCRDGEYNSALSATKGCRRTTAIGGTLSTDGHVIIQPHTGDTAVIYRLNINGQDVTENGFHFFNMRFASPNNVVVAGLSPTFVSLQGNPVAPPSDVKVTNCVGGTINPFQIGDDPYSFIEGMGDRFHAEDNVVEGCYDFIKCDGADIVIRNNYCKYCTNDGLKLTDCPRIIIEGNTITNKTVRYEEWTIASVSRGSTTTVNFTQAETNNPVTFRNTYIRGTGLAWLDGLWTSGQVSSTTSTSITFSYNSSGDTAWTSGGVVRQGLGSHGDFIQVLGGTYDGARDDMRISGNDFTRGEGTPDFTDGQGIYFQNPANGAATIRNLLIEGTVVNTNTGNAILMNNVESMEIRSCVFVRNHSSDLGANEVAAKILITTGDYTNVIVRDTITNGFSPGPNFINCITDLDQTSIPAYEALFVGPIPASGAEVEYDGYAIYQNKPGGAADIASPKQGLARYNRETLTYDGADSSPPVLLSTVPTDNATNQLIDTDITLTFNENIAFGSGNITVYDVTNTTNFEVFDVTTDNGTGPGTVGISGTTLTINPTSSLANSTKYAIKIDSGAIEDSSGNAFTGINDNTTVSFTTESIVSVSKKYTQIGGSVLVVSGSIITVT